MNVRSGRRNITHRTLAADADLAVIQKLGVTRLCNDSREVKRGDTFLAYPGAKLDGRRYIALAIAQGARSVVWERRGFKWPRKWRVANCAVTDLRARAGHLASRLNADPSAKLWMIGVTGTNGKTTCSLWIASSLNRLGVKTAVVGTLGYGLRGAMKPLLNTTPDALWLHARLARWAHQGACAVSMEVSSIGLDQGRVAGIQFDVAVFTNLTRDHLDYHGTMARYGSAKARLFASPGLRYAVVNLDDPFGARLASRLKRREVSVLGYGFGHGAGGAGRRLTASNLVADMRGLRFDVVTPWGKAHIRSSILGRFNAPNLLATLAVLLASGVSLARAVKTLARLESVPGRMQAVGGGRRPLIIIDYAHTPDALEKVLFALRELLGPGAAHRELLALPAARGKEQSKPQIFQRDRKLTCVFGCGGDRDRGKRPVMGRIAAQLADRVVVTSDNPRGEPPLKIIAEIIAGAAAANASLLVQADRRVAITRAVATANRDDIVLIAGKGHENYQEIAGVRRSFSDLNVARKALRQWKQPSAAFRSPGARNPRIKPALEAAH